MIEINKLRHNFHKHRNIKKCCCCGSGTNMLDNYDIKYKIARYRWFDRKGNLRSHQQQEEYKGDEQTVDNGTYASVSSTKTSG